MQKKYKIPLIIALSAIVLIGGLFWLNKISTTPESTSGIVLFVSDTCPHCRNVETYIDENKIIEKISFETKEVSKNPLNANDFTKKGNACDIPADEMGVPMLWDNGKCLTGDQPIIDFFKEKAQQK